MLTNNVFPIKVLPQEDELLSSWLVRLAIAHGQKLHTFTHLLWNKSAIWARDIDKSVNSEQIQILANKCGVNFDLAWKTTLADYAGWVYEKHNSLGANPWLTTIGIYHRKRVKFGQQFCPKCLDADAKPYFRRHWRLSFFTICPKHSIQLSDCCSECLLPINFHRDELGNFFSFAPSFTTRCFNCQFDLKKSHCCEDEVSSSEILFHEKLKRAIEKGFWNLTQNRPVHSLAFFAGLRQILKILSMNDKRIRNLRADFRHICPQPNQVADDKRKTTDFPELRVFERRNLLIMASSLLSDWSTTFVELSRKHNIWSSLWLRHLEQYRDGIFRPSPFWLWEVVSANLQKKKYNPTSREIKAAVRYLRLSNKPVNSFQLCKILGNYSKRLKHKTAVLYI